MPAISYALGVSQPLESVVPGTLAPASVGTIELRIDQTTTAITDGGTTRAIKRGEVQYMIHILEQYLLRDTTVAQ